MLGPLGPLTRTLPVGPSWEMPTRLVAQFRPHRVWTRCLLVGRSHGRQQPGVLRRSVGSSRPSPDRLAQTPTPQVRARCIPSGTLEGQRFSALFPHRSAPSGMRVRQAAHSAPTMHKPLPTPSSVRHPRCSLRRGLQPACQCPAEVQNSARKPF